MKKIVALVLVFVMLAGAALAQANPAGGWAACEAQPLPIPEEAAQAFEEAFEGFVGSDVTPVALLATQLVSGTNYCFLCQTRVVAPEARSEWQLVYVYKALSGKAEVKGFVPLEFSADTGEFEEGDVEAEEAPLGGWTVCETEEGVLSEEAAAAFEQTVKTLLGVDYVPVAELAAQVVSGANYCVLCRATVTAPEAEPYFALVYLYRDLSGNAELKRIAALEFALPEE